VMSLFKCAVEACFSGWVEDDVNEREEDEDEGGGGVDPHPSCSSGMIIQ